MTKSARIKELESIIEIKDRSIAHHEKLLKDLENKFADVEHELNEIAQVKSATPSDCTPGEWCSACKFSEEYFLRDHFTGYGNRIVHLCNKAGSCVNFVQKEI